MLEKERNFSRVSVPYATPLVLTAPAPTSRECPEEIPPQLKVSHSRKSILKFLTVSCYFRDSLKKKGGKWTDKNLDKYLKGPADYAPGKFLSLI